MAGYFDILSKGIYIPVTDIEESIVLHPVFKYICVIWIRLSELENEDHLVTPSLRAISEVETPFLEMGDPALHLCSEIHILSLLCVSNL